MSLSIADMPRTYGSGSLSIRTNKKGVESWYGQWRVNGVKVSRRVGLVRQPGSKVGMDARQAEQQLGHLMLTVTVSERQPEGMNLADAHRLYAAHLKRAGRKRSTITAVESCIRVWATPHFGQRPMDQVTYEDVELLIGKMEKKGLSAKSIHNYIGTISALYAFGMNPRRRWATENPCDGVELPAIEESHEIRFLTLEEVDALIRGVQPGDYFELDRVLYRTAAMTGLREGELIALRWMDIDWTARKVRVRRNHVLGEFDTPKSRRSSRSVPLAEEVAQALARWQPKDADDDDLVFADPLAGGPLDKAAIMRRMRRALKAAGLPKHVFHDLRHTFGTRCAATGTSMRTLQEWMGHRDSKTTERYADYAPSKHEVEMVDKAFAREGVPEGTSIESEGTHGIQEHRRH